MSETLNLVNKLISFSKLKIFSNGISWNNTHRDWAVKWLSLVSTNWRKVSLKFNQVNRFQTKFRAVRIAFENLDFRTQGWVLYTQNTNLWNQQSHKHHICNFPLLMRTWRSPWVAWQDGCWHQLLEEQHRSPLACQPTPEHTTQCNLKNPTQVIQTFHVDLCTNTSQKLLTANVTSSKKMHTTKRDAKHTDNDFLKEQSCTHLAYLCLLQNSVHVWWITLNSTTFGIKCWIWRK